jgi:hypothetical protein
MFTRHCRLPVSRTTWAALLIVLLGPAIASAQVGPVTDAPIAIHNSTDTHLAIEVIAILKRDGTVTPVNWVYQFQPRWCGWMEMKQAKLSGVAFAFIVHTPDKHQSRWVSTSNGADADGFFRVEFSKEMLQLHKQTPVPVGGLNRTTPDGLPWHREFIQHQINRVQQAIKAEENYILAAGVTGAGAAMIGKALDNEGKRRDNLKDELLGGVANAAGQYLSNQARSNIAAAQGRIQGYRQLIQGYERELAIPPYAPPLR